MSLAYISKVCDAAGLGGVGYRPQTPKELQHGPEPSRDDRREFSYLTEDA